MNSSACVADRPDTANKPSGDLAALSHVEPGDLVAARTVFDDLAADDSPPYLATAAGR